MIDTRMVSFCFHSITLFLHLNCCILFFGFGDDEHIINDGQVGCIVYFVLKEMLLDYRDLLFVLDSQVLLSNENCHRFWFWNR